MLTLISDLFPLFCAIICIKFKPIFFLCLCISGCWGHCGSGEGRRGERRCRRRHRHRLWEQPGSRHRTQRLQGQARPDQKHLQPGVGKVSKAKQLSNLWWMQNSVCMGSGTAMKRAHQDDSNDTPTTYMWVSSHLPFTVNWDIPGSLIHSKGKPTWNSHVSCGISSWWARYWDRGKTYADWVWHSL